MTLQDILNLARAQGAVELVGKVIDLAAYATEAAGRGALVLTTGQQADFDAIHREALDANAELDAKLAAAEQH